MHCPIEQAIQVVRKEAETAAEETWWQLLGAIQTRAGVSDIRPGDFQEVSIANQKPRIDDLNHIAKCVCRRGGGLMTYRSTALL